MEKHTLSGPASRQLQSPALQRLLRAAWDEQKRFPLQIATILSQQFAGHGLQFFKVNKTITHVSVARPHYLDMQATPVSDQVKRIVEIIDATPKCTRRMLVEKLAPTPVAAAPAPVVNPAEAAAAPGTEAGPVAPPTEAAPTPEQAGIIGDLHWLIHQGHVIEFANGVLETAKKPAVKPPKPPKPEAKTAPAPAAPEAAQRGAAVEPSMNGGATEPEAVAEPVVVPEPAVVESAPEANAPAEPAAEPPPEPAAT